MYHLVWSEVTLDLLASIYVEADEDQRFRMANGVAALNVRLKTMPSEVGESRGDGFRIAFTPLLVIALEVDEMARLVRVYDVARYGR